MEQNEYRTPGGPVEHYYVIRRKPFVVIVAERNSTVLLIQQYRPATDRVYLCLPAGYVGPDEDPAVAAQRELQEETGYRAVGMQYLTTLHPLPGYIDSPGHVFECTLAEQGGDGGTDEALGMTMMPWADVLSAIARGEILEMQAVAGLLVAYYRKQGEHRPGS